MTERWQAELTKLRGARLPADLWDRVDEGPRLAPLGPSPRSRVAAVVAAFLVFAVGGVLVWRALAPADTSVRSLAGPDVLEVPARGDASAVFLADGHPVFVVHHEDDSVSVLDAFSSHTPFGLRDIIGWCPSTAEFVELAHEARFDELGNWLTAGPAPHGLTTFQFDVVERDADGRPTAIRVGAARDPSPGGSAHETDPSTYPAFCPAADGGAASSATTAVVSGVTEQTGYLVTHAIDAENVWPTPAGVVEAGPEGWVAVEGQLLVSRDGFVELCTDVVEGTCVDGAVVRGIDGIRLLLEVITPNPNFYAVHPYTWLARVRDGVLVDIAGVKGQVVPAGS
jgi:hypothetical protein